MKCFDLVVAIIDSADRSSLTASRFVLQSAFVRLPVHQVRIKTSTNLVQVAKSGRKSKQKIKTSSSGEVGRSSSISG